jgi:hypothetical protein
MPCRPLFAWKHDAAFWARLMRGRTETESQTGMAAAVCSCRSRRYRDLDSSGSGRDARNAMSRHFRLFGLRGNVVSSNLVSVVVGRRRWPLVAVGGCRDAIASVEHSTVRRSAPGEVREYPRPGGGGGGRGFILLPHENDCVVIGPW